MGAAETAVLLVNLGTPRSPRAGDVRRYLREFLGDPLVLDMPAPLRFLLLEGVILPFRPRRTARAYQKIWSPEGSPLLVHGRALARALTAELGGGYAVEIAMRAMFHTHKDVPLRRQPIREELEALLTEHPIERRLRKGQGHGIACLPGDGSPWGWREHARRRQHAWVEVHAQHLARLPHVRGGEPGRRWSSGRE